MGERMRFSMDAILCTNDYSRDDELTTQRRNRKRPYKKIISSVNQEQGIKLAIESASSYEDFRSEREHSPSRPESSSVSDEGVSGIPKITKVDEQHSSDTNLDSDRRLHIISDKSDSITSCITPTKIDLISIRKNDLEHDIQPCCSRMNSMDNGRTQLYISEEQQSTLSIKDEVISAFEFFYSILLCKKC